MKDRRPLPEGEPPVTLRQMLTSSQAIIPGAQPTSQIVGSAHCLASVQAEGGQN